MHSARIWAIWHSSIKVVKQWLWPMQMDIANRGYEKRLRVDVEAMPSKSIGSLVLLLQIESRICFGSCRSKRSSER